MATKDELKQQIEDLNKKISVLDWDKARDQINPSKLATLDNLKKERSELKEQMAEAPEKEEKKEEPVAEETTESSSENNSEEKTAESDSTKE